MVRWCLLSADAVFDAADTRLVWSQVKSEALAGASYTKTATAAMQWDPGDHYLILDSDMGRNIYESDESDNTLAVDPSPLSRSRRRWRWTRRPARPPADRSQFPGVCEIRVRSRLVPPWVRSPSSSWDDVWDAADVKLGGNWVSQRRTCGWSNVHAGAAGHAAFGACRHVSPAGAGRCGRQPG